MLPGFELKHFVVHQAYISGDNARWQFDDDMEGAVFAAEHPERQRPTEDIWYVTDESNWRSPFIVYMKLPDARMSTEYRHQITEYLNRRYGA